MPKPKIDYSAIEIAPESFYPIVGMHFRPPAQSMLNALPLGAEMLLVRERTNAYDQNAVMVMIANFNDQIDVVEAIRNYEALNDADWPGWTNDHVQVGYIPRELAAKIAPVMDYANIAQIAGTYAQNTTGAPCVTGIYLEGSVEHD